MRSNDYVIGKIQHLDLSWLQLEFLDSRHVDIYMFFTLCSESSHIGPGSWIYSWIEILEGIHLVFLELLWISTLFCSRWNGLPSLHGIIQNSLPNLHFMIEGNFFSSMFCYLFFLLLLVHLWLPVSEKSCFSWCKYKFTGIFLKNNTMTTRPFIRKQSSLPFFFPLGKNYRLIVRQLIDTFLDQI